MTRHRIIAGINIYNIEIYMQTRHHTDQICSCRFLVCREISQALNFYAWLAKDCEELSPPKRGAVACDNWLFGHFCSPFCHNESTFPRGEISAKVWTCGPNLKWFPSPRLPDCTGKKVV